jgi:hypothetical protein
MNFIKAKLRFLSMTLGPPQKSGDGINYAFKCPSCNKQSSNKKKLVIRLDNDHFHCWVCDFRGRSIQSILKKFFPQSLAQYHQDILGKKFDKTTIASDASPVDVKIPKGFMLLSQQLQGIDPDVHAVISYARSRGISEKEMWYFKLGTCTTGRFRRRLIIPSFDEDGSLNYYVARAIDATQTRKYLNPPVPKKDIIFNEINIRWNQEITLVEGPMDLVKSNYNSTCLLGSSLTESYILFKKIIKNQTPVLLALDSDVKIKSHKIAKLLYSYGINVRMLGEHEYEDVGAMPCETFKVLKENSQLWCDKDRLYHLIGGIKSGSLI